MKILTVSDVESRALWDYFDPKMLEGVDLVLSCGDLKPQYLSFIATFTHAPVLYVHGNHDASYKLHPPEGCTCIEDSIYDFCGLRILGLGGSMRYKAGPFQYTEQEMARRVQRMRYQLLRRRGFDILLTHAPARGLYDGEDLPHRGFECFNQLMDKYAPRCFIHGHVHLNYGALPRTYMHQNTLVVNTYERHVFTLDTPDPARDPARGPKRPLGLW